MGSIVTDSLSGGARIDPPIDALAEKIGRPKAELLGLAVDDMLATNGHCDTLTI